MRNLVEKTFTLFIMDFNSYATILWNFSDVFFFFLQSLQTLMISLWMMMDSPSLKRRERNSLAILMRKFCKQCFDYVNLDFPPWCDGLNHWHSTI